MLDIELNLYSENPDLYTLQADKDDIEPIMDVIGDNMAKLSSFKALEQMSEHQMQVDSVIGSAYKLKREIKQRLRGLSTSQESVVSVVTPLTSSVSYVVSSTAATSVSMGITSDSTPVSSTQTQPTKPSGAPMVPDTTEDSTSIETMFPLSTSTTQATMFVQPKHVYLATNPFRASTPIKLPGTTDTDSADKTKYITTGVMGSTLASPVVPQTQQTPFVMGSTLASPVVSQIQQSPLSMPQYEVSSSYTPLSVPFSPEPRTHVTFPTDYDNFTPSNRGMSANHGNVQLKKNALPVFTGHRKDWPEFKAV